jgi:glycosyltransferase involved in cell wall biosynthesis
MSGKPWKVLFHREYRQFQGGHLKVFDYFNHVRAAEGFEPSIYFSAGAIRDHPWRGDPAIVDRYDPSAADILFLAGMDWRALDGYPSIEDEIPVINLLQGVRHGEPGHVLSTVLGRRAIRVCVSEQVADVVRSSGLCNGPVLTIPIGIDLGEVEGDRPKPRTVFIAGLKDPALARAVAGALASRGIDVDCQIERIARREFLDRLGLAEIAVVLPHRAEGFFLPAIEAMAAGCAVICPDCIGNRSFCLDGETCLVVPFQALTIVAAVHRLLSDTALARKIASNGRDMAQRHDIVAERLKFQQLLETIRVRTRQ